MLGVPCVNLRFVACTLQTGWLVKRVELGACALDESASRRSTGVRLRCWRRHEDWCLPTNLLTQVRLMLAELEVIPDAGWRTDQSPLVVSHRLYHELRRGT